MSLVSFASDNHAGVHPIILKAMVEANEGFAASYEQDPWSQDLKSWLKVHFQAQDAALVFNGTAANVLCLQLALESYGSVLCAQDSHLHLDECGAPEKIAGVKVIPCPTDQGKLTPETLKPFLLRRGDQHFSQVGLVSITQPTERGHVYSLEELAQLGEFCQREKLLLHVDGARLANAAAHLGVSLGEAAGSAQLISLGGAKKGLMLGELVIVRSNPLGKKLKFLRKQSLQLPAKTRFLAAGFQAYLCQGLWQELALWENNCAGKLRAGLEGINGVKLTNLTQANSVFCQLPRKWVKPLREEFFFYVWDPSVFEVRLMTSFLTTENHVQAFVERLKQFATKE